MTGVFLQVRLASSRLPRKALLQLADRPVVEHALRSLRRVPAAVHCVLTDSASADDIRPVAERCGYQTFVGSETNVLERYVTAIRAFGVDEVVRATGDNPLVSWELARMAVALRRRERADYAAFDGPPLGTGVEVVRADALERAYASSPDDYDIEHATPFLYRHPDRFTVVRRQAPPAYCAPDARVTIDTADDYERIGAIFAAIYDGEPIAALRLVRHLHSHDRSTPQPGSERHENSAGT